MKKINNKKNLQNYFCERWHKPKLQFLNAREIIFRKSEIKFHEWNLLERCVSNFVNTNNFRQYCRKLHTLWTYPVNEFSSTSKHHSKLEMTALIFFTSVVVFVAGGKSIRFGKTWIAYPFPTLLDTHSWNRASFC